MILLDDRLLQLFQWEHRVRVLWLDGRELPAARTSITSGRPGTGTPWPSGKETR